MLGTSTVRAAGRAGVPWGSRIMVAETLAITSATMLIADSIRIFLSGVMFGLGVLRPIVNVFPDMLGHRFWAPSESFPALLPIRVSQGASFVSVQVRDNEYPIEASLF